MSKITEDKGIEIRDSRTWRWVVEELDYRIEIGLGELRACDSEDLPFIQYKLKILESLKRLPDDVVERETYSVSD